jgi:asparagine synthase (glutamine-hydrolysing)
MPGITGIIGKTSPEKHKQDIGHMVNCMLHESFYESGTFNDDQMGVFVGWICHKGSFCDCMPVWNEKKNVVLIFFGENFTDLELFDQLKSKNHRFDNTNASYIVHMYEEKGPDFLLDLNGCFCGILIDIKLSRIILFNDRYGIQKIFYYEGKNAFYFSSEAKCLLNVCPELRNLDMQGVAEMLACNCVLENRTLYKDVSLLPVASAWIFEKDKLKNDTYFSPDVWENQTWLEKNLFYERLEGTFRKILPRYLRANQKIGISLTGGVDSRMILANIDMAEGKYPCYTFGGMYRDNFDVSISRKVAAVKKQSHETITVGHEFLSNFAHWAEKTTYITDGYLEVNGSSEIYINKLARQIAPIRLTGNFGGEVLRSIRHIKPSPVMAGLFHPDLYHYVDNIPGTLKQYEKDPLSFVLFHDSPWHNNNRMVSEQSQVTMRTPYLDNELTALMYRLQADVRKDKQMSLRLISGDPAVAKFPTDRGLQAKPIFLFSPIKHFICEFSAKAEYAYDYGMPQWLARLDHLFRFMHFEKLFLGRHKFNHYRVWYRDDLSDYVKTILLDSRTLTRPYLNKKTVEDIVKAHTSGNRNYTTEITQLLSVELIQRLLIEQ